MANVSLEGMTPDQIADLAVMAKSQLDNPKTRTHFLRNQKFVTPETSIPEVDIPMQTEALLNKGYEQLRLMQGQLDEERIRRQIMERRQDLMERHSLTKKDVEEVEKLMLEKQIASHDTAAEFYKSQQQSAQPTPSIFSQNQMPKVDLKAAGMPNMNSWARSTATQVIDEMRGRIKVKT